MPKDHHCSYRTCPNSKTKCNVHYWTCTGGDVTHEAVKVFQGKRCERRVKRVYTTTGKDGKAKTQEKIERCDNSKN